MNEDTKLSFSEYQFIAEPHFDEVYDEVPELLRENDV